MAPSIPTTEPTQFAAGDSLKWNLTIADYPPSDGWALSYVFEGKSAVMTLGSTEITPDASNSLYQVVVPVTKTTPLNPDARASYTYDWAAILTKTATGERLTLRRGSVIVLPDPAKAAPTATRAEKLLADYQTAHDAILAGRVRDYSIAGRHFTKLDLPFLTKRIAVLSEQVSRERAAAENGSAVFGRSINVRFRSPSF